MAHFHHVTPILRKDRDSNPGTPKGVNGFRDRPVRPLRHLSNGRFLFLKNAHARKAPSKLEL